jgi:HlyD family secretion protein
VITYNVVIDVQNPELKLKPGMTANLTITIAERQDTLKIPNAALRFRPQGMTPEKMRELFRGGDHQANSSGPRPGGGKDAGKDNAKDATMKEGQAAQANGQQQGTDGGGERRRRGDRGNQADGQQGAPEGAKRAGAGGAPAASVTATPPVPATTPIQAGQVRIVWVLGPDKQPQPRRIRLGITDGTATEIIEGDLKEGDTIIVSQTIGAEDRQQNNQQRAPGFGGGMPGGGPRGGFGGGGGGRGR